MKRRIILFVLILVCFLLQTAVWNLLPLGNVKPNLLLVLTVSFGLMCGKKTGMWMGFLSGILTDLFYGSLFGFTALIYMYIGYIVGKFYMVFYDEEIKIPMLMAAVSDFVYNIIFYVVQFAFRQRFDFGDYMVHIILPEILYTILCMLILYKLFYALNRRLTANELEDRDSPWLLK